MRDPGSQQARRNPGQPGAAQREAQGQAQAQSGKQVGQQLRQGCTLAPQHQPEQFQQADGQHQIHQMQQQLLLREAGDQGRGVHHTRARPSR